MLVLVTDARYTDVSWTTPAPPSPAAVMEAWTHDRLFNGLDQLSFNATYAIPARVTLSGPGVASRDVSTR